MVANRTGRTPNRRAFKQSFIVTQQSAGTWVSGDYVPGATTDINLSGSVQPADGDTVLQLTEAERQSEVISLWTNGIDDNGDMIKIKPVRFGTDQTQGDTILFDGVDYQVRKVLDFGAHGHQEIVAVKMENQNG